MAGCELEGGLPVGPVGVERTLKYSTDSLLTLTYKGELDKPTGRALHTRPVAVSSPGRTRHLECVRKPSSRSSFSSFSPLCPIPPLPFQLPLHPLLSPPSLSAQCVLPHICRPPCPLTPPTPRDEGHLHDKLRVQPGGPPGPPGAGEGGAELVGAHHPRRLLPVPHRPGVCPRPRGLPAHR